MPHYALSGTSLYKVANLTADPGVVSYIQSSPFLLWRLIIKKFYGYSPPSADSRRVVVSYKRSMCTEIWLTA